MKTPVQEWERERHWEPVLGNLPRYLTPLLGRGEALENLRGLLWQTRLLTLCGPGGVGKSRLAVALGEAVRDDLVAGTWWADVADCSDAGLVAQTVAATVLPGEPVNDPLTALTRHLDAPSLLILDNCELLAAPCAALAAALLARSPALRIVATSRQSLGLAGEQVWRVEGLGVEPAGRARTARHPAAGEDGGVALFAARAREVAGGFALEAPGVRETVAEICRWLDGLPLAIELAAARVAVLGVEQIAQRIRQDSEFLRRPGHAVPPRQRTLHDTLAWSYQLLDGSERRLFARLAAFGGSFSLAAAERVCADEQLSADDVLDVLGRLVDQSLVQVIPAADAPRYRLLSVVRQYAEHRLRETGEEEVVRRRLADHFVDAVDDLRAALAGPQQARWLQELELDHDNLRRVLRWLLARQPADAARLAAALWPFFYGRGYYAEARAWYEQALEHEAQLDDRLAVDLLLAAGAVTFLQCDYAVARERLHRALRRLGGQESGRSAALAFGRLGAIAREQADYGEARRLHGRSLDIWAALDDAEGVAGARNALGFVSWLSGDLEEAQRHCTDALAVARARANERAVVWALLNRGAGALYAGAYECSAEDLAEALAVSRRLGFQEGIAWASHELAILDRRRPRSSHDAPDRLRDALVLDHQLGDRWRLASVLEEVAGAVLARRDPRAAARVLACAERLREQIGTPVPLVEAPDREAAMHRVRRGLSGAALSEAWSQGRSLSVSEGVDLALSALDELDAARPAGRVVSSAPILTPRELAVLSLLSEGHTNREIASALYISPSTAGVHVSNILRKLRAKRRTDAARQAQALGLLSA